MDLSPVTRAEMFVDKLELGPDANVKLLRHNGTNYVTLLTVTQDDDWSMTAVANLYVNVDFMRFLVMDYPGFEEIVAQTEFVLFEGILHRLERKHRPMGLNRVWDFKLEPTSEFPTTLP